MKLVKHIEIQLVYETNDEFMLILDRIKDVLPPNLHIITFDQGFNKPQEWDGFNDDTL